MWYGKAGVQKVAIYKASCGVWQYGGMKAISAGRRADPWARRHAGGEGLVPGHALFCMSKGELSLVPFIGMKLWG